MQDCYSAACTLHPGRESKYELTQVDSSTRESVLTSDQVDAVFATYSITDARKEVISFAGPYYTSKQAVLVKAGNTDITAVDDLAGKIVATQSGSTGPDILAEYAPEATVQEFANDPGSAYRSGAGSCRRIRN